MSRQQSVVAGQDPELRDRLFYLLGRTRGGPNRARIISFLRERPANTNQIATHLGVHYKAAVWHIEVLRKYSLIEPYKVGYAAQYHLVSWLEAHFNVFEDVAGRLSPKFNGGAARAEQ